MSLDKRREKFEKTLFLHQPLYEEIRAQIHADPCIDTLAQQSQQCHVTIESAQLLLRNYRDISMLDNTHASYLGVYQEASETLISTHTALFERYQSLYINSIHASDITKRAIILNEWIKTFNEIRKIYRCLTSRRLVRLIADKKYFDGEMQYILLSNKKLSRSAIEEAAPDYSVTQSNTVRLFTPPAYQDLLEVPIESFEV